MKNKTWYGIGLIFAALAVYAAAEGLIETESGDLTLSPAGGDVIVNGNVGVGTAEPNAKLEVKGGGVQQYLSGPSSGRPEITNDVVALRVGPHTTSLTLPLVA